MADLQVLTGGDPLDGPAALAAASARPLTSVRMNTMRSPFLPRDLRPVVGVGRVRQVLVLLVLLLDRVEQVLRCEMPRAPPAMTRLIASFLARRTMFSIMAPDEKSLKYRISLSPFW